MAHPILLGLLCSLLSLVPGGGDARARFAGQCARARAGSGPVRILHFGDSHLAGTGGAEFRRLFQSLWGDGGPGFGLPWLQPGPGVRASASRGWHKRRPGPASRPEGLAAGALTADRAGEVAALEAPFSRFRLHLRKAPDGGRAGISVDGAVLGEVDLAGPAGLALFQRDLPPRPGVRRLEVRTLGGGPVTILGVALEGAAGVVYSPLAFNGAKAAWLADLPAEQFRAEVAAEAPDLIMLAFGTNEALDRGPEAAGYRRGLEALLERFRAAAPQAAIALVGPPDLDPRRGAAQGLAGVIAAQRAVAAAGGFLFMDQCQQMGGAGAMPLWFREGLANPDLVHLTPPGYRRLSQFVTQAILTGTAQPGLPAALPSDPGWIRARLGGPGEPATGAPGPNRIYLYRNQDGRTLVTNNPRAAEDSNGEWIMEQTH